MLKSVLKSIPLVLALALVAVCFVPAAHADQWDKKTIVTISAPVVIPNGKVLDAGTHVFKLLDSPSNRHIVQIFDKDQKHLEATILAIPNERLRPTGKTVISFWEMPAGQHNAIRAWFYPGDNMGQEFAYPKNMATQIASASATHEQPPVLTQEDETMISQSSESKQPEQVAQNEQPANMPPARSQTTSDTTAPAPARRELPTTGSFLPLTGLLGFLSFGIGAAFRRIVRG